MRRRFLSGVAASLAAPPLIACAPDLDALVGPPGPGTAGLPPPLIWDGLLARHRRVDAGGVAGFAYGAVSAVEQDDLADYLRALAATDPAALDRRQGAAFWLNLYNASLVRLVIQHYMIARVDDIGFGLFGLAGPWRQPLIRIAGRPLSLDDIEHRVLRREWRDPRLLYGLCKGARGGPNLPPVAFTARNLDSLLEDLTTAYVNHPRALRADGDTLVLSRFYQRNQAAFGGAAGVRAHLRDYAGPALRPLLAGARTLRYHFDDRLNDATGQTGGAGG